MRIASILLLCLATTAALAEHYGAPITMRHSVPLEQAIGQLGGQLAADVLVEGQVDKVCQAKGCWLGLKGTSGNVHVTFKNEAFFVPATLIGKTVRVQGKLTKVAMTLEETRRHVQAAGGDPARVKQPAARYEMVASGLTVETGKQED
jgi:Domain of unknown function (DUF4920)